MLDGMPIEEFFKLGMDRNVPTPVRDYGHGLKRINLGGVTERLGADIESIGYEQDWDGEVDALPFYDESVDEIWAVHFFEHIRNLVPLLRECERVMKTGAIMNIVVPYGAVHMAIHDVTHVRFFNEDSWPHLFYGTSYYLPAGPWRLRIHTNFIMGVKGENIALLTQVIKE